PDADLVDLVSRALRLEESSADDPEDQPYKSRYEARKLLNEAISIVNAEGLSSAVETKAEGDSSSPDPEFKSHRRQLRLLWLKIRLASNYLETDEASEGYRMLTALLEADNEVLQLNDGGTDQSGEVVVADSSSANRYLREAAVKVQLYNWLGCACCHLNRHADAIEFLQQAEAAFLRAKRLLAADESARAWDLSDLFPSAVKPANEKEEAASALADSCSLESLHTKTLFYLAQAFGKADRPADSARYCQMTLNRQLALSDYAASEWAVNCAALSQYYLGVRDFARAHRCLCAASAVLAEAEAANPEAFAAHDPDSELQHNRASISRCWVKYAIALLEYSRDLAQHQLEDCRSEADYEDLFPSVEAGHHADKVAYVPAVNFEQARAIFLFAQRHLTSAKDFFRLDEHCTDHAELVRDHSRAFLHLLQFELDSDRRARMHKRRADMLRELLSQLSQQYYLLLCRQIRFELGETLVDLLDIKLSALESQAAAGQTPSPAAVAKANAIGRDAVTQFDLFVDSFRLPPPESRLPDRLEALDTRPVLLALFHSARVSARLPEPSRDRRLANLRRAEANYRQVSEYCERVPEAASVMSPELDLIRDMLALMPVKVQTVMDKFA
ncbi:hypothetical protein BOX15_Mlig003246g2, partial [Macrostomum lignano]